MSEDYATNLLRGATAHLFLQSSMMASKDVFSKSYFALSQDERRALDRMVYDALSQFYGALTNEFFVGQQQKTPVGFGIPRPDSLGT